MWAFWYRKAKFWGHSSVGRAPALQAGGRQFESDWLHHTSPRLRVASHQTKTGIVEKLIQIRQKGVNT